ncbi:MAG: hypothetical protein KIT56_05295 [Gammaproteobacteria bacterium]|nr:hypothetical protein [Gammaproteobacteria bacterium]
MNKNQGYQGVYTSALSSCVAVAMIERNEKTSEIDRILMVHFAGGICKEHVVFLQQQLKEHQFTKKLECIVCGGNNYTTELYTIKESFLRETRKIHYLSDYLDKNINITYLASISICVTFDGYVGAFEYNACGLPNRFTKDYVLPDVVDAYVEEDALDKPIGIIQCNQDNPYYFLCGPLKEILGIIADEDSKYGYTEENKSQLFKYTRELIVKTQFQWQGNIEMQKAVFTDYLQKIKSIFATDKDKAEQFIEIINKIFSQSEALSKILVLPHDVPHSHRKQC